MINKLSTISFSEKELSVTTDDYGTIYYYRGNVQDNYVNFAGMCWRIIRIAGDGSIKLILEDQDQSCATSNGNWDIPIYTNASETTGQFGYTIMNYSGSNYNSCLSGDVKQCTNYIEAYTNPESNKGISQIYVFHVFQRDILSSYLDKLKSGDWCFNNKAYSDKAGNSIINDKTPYYTVGTDLYGTEFYYDTYARLSGDSGKYNPRLKCNGKIMNKFNNSEDMYVGAITADEVAYAGGKYYSGNKKILFSK